MRMRGVEFVVVLLLILDFRTALSKNRHHNTWFNNSQSIDHQKRMESTPKLEQEANLNIYSNRSATENSYTEWSKWGRCINCLQRRMKVCIHHKCHNSRMYEERECHKKRCKRKKKKLIAFHIVHTNTSSSYLTKQAPSVIWSKWSKWTECSFSCRTYRIRNCKKPGRCHKQSQTEYAYCYHERTKCEDYVLNIVAAQQRSFLDKRYQYAYHNNQFIARESRSKADQCGLTFSKPRMLKIIGGSEAQRYKWPWHAAILNQFKEVFCGGTLIAPKWVLTASHCVRQKLRVRLLAHDLRSTEGNDIEMSVSKIFAHPSFELKTVDNDIALLMLPRQVRVPVACLPTKKPKAGQLCSVMGWGKIHTSDMFGVSVLHEAKLPLVTHKRCRKAYKEFLISTNMMCAGWRSGKADTCAGDSGGGLMCPNRKKIYSIQGITSFGDGCGGRNKFGIYTAVYNYIDWIRYIIDLHT
ncbi:hypothetical protein ABEB36_003423 [Hypothenemus hampei]|uniref:Peptidase S1 domain-containing protein n=1 Tax=Hypothenemus hampei TaxID=57062 RepID=A0ABD1F936_HYPHA